VSLLCNVLHSDLSDFGLPKLPVSVCWHSNLAAVKHFKTSSQNSVDFRPT